MHKTRRNKNVIRNRHATGQIDDLIAGKRKGKEALEIDAPALPLATSTSAPTMLHGYLILIRVMDSFASARPLYSSYRSSAKIA